MKQPEVGQIIHDLRLAFGLTQEQLATSLGVTYSTINRWENGRSTPSPMAMKLIEQKLDEMGVQGQDLLAKYLPKWN
ncbi:helix-turn-helix domain-containing protein [Nostoc linckia]|nr:helix-turn-helix transcriptional regulator [Nostoc linckia]